MLILLVFKKIRKIKIYKKKKEKRKEKLRD